MHLLGRAEHRSVAAKYDRKVGAQLRKITFADHVKTDNLRMPLHSRAEQAGLLGNILSIACAQHDHARRSVAVGPRYAVLASWLRHLSSAQF